VVVGAGVPTGLLGLAGLAVAGVRIVGSMLLSRRQAQAIKLRWAQRLAGARSIIMVVLVGMCCLKTPVHALQKEVAQGTGQGPIRAASAVRRQVAQGM
jgi:hypothetical protein